MEPGSLVQLSSDDGYDFIHVGECEFAARRDTWEVPVGTIAMVLGEFKGTSQSLKLRILINNEVGWVFPEEVVPVWKAR
jgi:hypothetical protein